jgi:hypothetical protein
VDGTVDEAGCEKIRERQVAEDLVYELGREREKRWHRWHIHGRFVRRAIKGHAVTFCSCHRLAVILGSGD